jgi:hypothetical protein
MGLNVGVTAMEEAPGPGDREAFHRIDVDAASVIPVAGITFSILGGEDASGGLSDVLRRIILGTNELNSSVLPLSFRDEIAFDFFIKHDPSSLALPLN